MDDRHGYRRGEPVAPLSSPSTADIVLLDGILYAIGPIRARARIWNIDTVTGEVTTINSSLKGIGFTANQNAISNQTSNPYRTAIVAKLLLAPPLTTSTGTATPVIKPRGNLTVT